MRNEGVIPSDDLLEEEITYIGLANIESGTGACSPVMVSGGSLKSSVKRFVAGDVLYAKMRPALRKACLVGNDIPEGFTSAECLVLRPKADPCTGNPTMLPALLAILLRSDLVYGQVVHLVTGIGRPRVSPKAILDVQLPIPPLTEQRRLLELQFRSEKEACGLVAEGKEALRQADMIRSDAQLALTRCILSPAKD